MESFRSRWATPKEKIHYEAMTYITAWGIGRDKRGIGYGKALLSDRYQAGFGVGSGILD